MIYQYVHLILYTKSKGSEKIVTEMVLLKGGKNGTYLCYERVSTYIYSVKRRPDRRLGRWVVEIRTDCSPYGNDE